MKDNDAVESDIEGENKKETIQGIEDCVLGVSKKGMA